MVDAKRGRTSVRSCRDGIVRTSRRLENQSCKLARPIVVPVRQNFAVQASFFPMGSVSALDGLNTGATDDEKEIKFVLDGQLLN